MNNRLETPTPYKIGMGGKYQDQEVAYSFLY